MSRASWGTWGLLTLVAARPGGGGTPEPPDSMDALEGDVNGLPKPPAAGALKPPLPVRAHIALVIVDSRNWRSECCATHLFYSAAVLPMGQLSIEEDNDDLSQRRCKLPAAPEPAVRASPCLKLPVGRMAGRGKEVGLPAAGLTLEAEPLPYAGFGA